jgi:hypothetical protein
MFRVVKRPPGVNANSSDGGALIPAHCRTRVRTRPHFRERPGCPVIQPLVRFRVDARPPPVPGSLDVFSAGQALDTLARSAVANGPAQDKNRFFSCLSASAVEGCDTQCVCHW